ncbi:GbsR/MarR family transcriptional regulator [Opitutus terrae]|uniref:Transcriptional regulator protein-like protein n=1 Tax=Opitutus terrae (strain DSM 11246 / JCM 15787 / PB90-1) TaxID=452637 RepID=B1ZV70_OPITP|nr:helix-turn-helix domain-containing protein [Opitutus terrae]ACB76737.1 transcriptional regulator protein-like protein [Opitutus terrae PB90-1]
MSRLPPAPASDDPYLAAPGAEVTAEFQQACVEFFGDVVHALGVPRSVGQIYGLLYASPQPLSFTDIAEKLDISRGSTSQGLQALKELGAVVPVGDGSREQGAGSRNGNPAAGGGQRQLFQPQLELRQLVGGLLREKVTPLVNEGPGRLKRLRELAESSPTPAGKKFAEKRLAKLDTWRRQMRLLLPLLKTILGPVRRA